MYSHLIPIIPSRETMGGKRDRQDKRHADYWGYAASTATRVGGANLPSDFDGTPMNWPNRAILRGAAMLHATNVQDRHEGIWRSFLFPVLRANYVCSENGIDIEKESRDLSQSEMEKYFE